MSFLSLFYGFCMVLRSLGDFVETLKAIAKIGPLKGISLLIFCMLQANACFYCPLHVRY